LTGGAFDPVRRELFLGGEEPVACAG